MVTTHAVPPLLVLQARAEARAILYAAGEYQCIKDAVAPLFDYAMASGIVDEIGAERAFTVITQAFPEVAENMQILCGTA